MSLIHLLTPAIAAAERGTLPDAMIRLGIRRLLNARLSDVLSGSCEVQQNRKMDFIDQCRSQPIAAVPELANEQHYEVPTELFAHTLGPRMKYSCCLWEPGVDQLDQAEIAALEATCERAQLKDGQSVLELGCGWGSLSLWMAEHYPNSSVTAVSNSRTQRTYIEKQAESRGLSNLFVKTADINDLRCDQLFDRVVSVEMFEHTRNHAELMRRIASWLVPGGNLFVHLFCHRSMPYFYESKGDGDWMASQFFSGGIMPSDDLLLHYQDDLRAERQWRWNGQHYERTCNAWLRQFDDHTDQVRAILQKTYGVDQAERWRQRWRIFYMSCAELFGFNQGSEWWVCHYRFEK